MPKTQVIFFQEKEGKAPVVEWLRELKHSNAKAWANCRAKIELLGQFGHELRRPAADILRDGIYELRAKQGHVQYRILYFFHGRNVAILAHSLTRKMKCPPLISRERFHEKNCLPRTRRSIPMRAKTKKTKTSDAIKILDRMAGDSPALKRLTQEARVNVAVAQLIYEARQASGLSQGELAERIGSKQAVISRLEDADYEGHSLNMLLRIAAALGKEIRIEFRDAPKMTRKNGPSQRLAHAHADS